MPSEGEENETQGAVIGEVMAKCKYRGECDYVIASRGTSSIQVLRKKAKDAEVQSPGVVVSQHASYVPKMNKPH